MLLCTLIEPRAHHGTVPDGALPQSGCVARNGIPATDCTEYTTVAADAGHDVSNGSAVPFNTSDLATMTAM